MHAVGAAFEQLRTDGGPLLAAAAWTAAPSLSTLVALVLILFVALLAAGDGERFAIIRLRQATGSNR
jgi:hypothetical protein